MTLPEITLSQSLRLTAAPSLVRGWIVGQVLTATVLESTADGRAATLEIAGRRFQAVMPEPALVGARLSLRVAQLGRQPILTRVADSPPPTAADETPVAAQQALKTMLPRQAPLPPLLANLANLVNPARPMNAESVAPSANPATATGSPAAPPAANQTAATAANGPARPLPASGISVPPRLMAAVTRLVEALYTAAEVATPATLKRAIADSGLFLEPRLAATATRNLPNGSPPAADVSRDFKAQLLKLAATLPATADTLRPPATPDQGTQPPPLRSSVPVPQPAAPPTLTTLSTPEAVKELTGQVQSALSRIEVQQINSLPQSGQAGAVWLLELPIRDQDRIDLLQLRIEEGERRRGDDAPASWSVTVATDLEGVGPLVARVSLTAGQVYATFWAEREGTRALVHSYRDWLRQRMQDAGLSVAGIDCIQGTPSAIVARPADPLVDVRI
jgi:hypothetical protein